MISNEDEHSLYNDIFITCYKILIYLFKNKESIYCLNPVFRRRKFDLIS